MDFDGIFFLLSRYNLNRKIYKYVIPAHVFTHPLITNTKNEITRLKYSNEKQEKLLVLNRTAIVLSLKKL
jgi:hypothetical protein